MKERMILILSVLVAIFFLGTIGSCSNAHRNKVARDKEMATRLDLEEKAGNFNKEKSALDDKLSSATKDLEKQKEDLQNTKKALLEEQMINKSLNEDLEKITKLKETLEEDLKEALTKGKVKK